MLPAQVTEFWGDLWGWIVTSAIVAALAWARGVVLDRRGESRWQTTVRGGSWLAAAIGCVYVKVWLGFDDGLWDREFEPVGVNPGGLLVLWGLLLLPIAVVWSIATAVAGRRQAEHLDTSAGLTSPPETNPLTVPGR